MISLAKGRRFSPGLPSILWRGVVFVATACSVTVSRAAPGQPGLSPSYPRIAGLSVKQSNDAKPGSVDLRVTGRLIINELNCTACHDGLPDTDIKPKAAPSLAGITQRVRADWLRRFIANPDNEKAGTTMPMMFAGKHGNDPALVRDQVDALVHYLGSTRLPKPLVSLPRRSTASRGELLYHRFGCVACHGPNPVGHSVGNLKTAATTASFPRLERKYGHRSLTDFLLDPLRYRPGGRMPDMKLSLQDASDIAAYLIRKAGDMDNKNAKPLPRFQQDPAKAKRGRELFQAIGCVNCHTVPGVKPLPRRRIVDVSKGQRHDPCAGRPAHVLTNSMWTAVLRVLKPPSNAPVSLDAKQTVELSLRTFNCYACHWRDGRGGPRDRHKAFFLGDNDLADEGKFPPGLTGVGRKLTPAWMAKVFAGEGDVRPYMHTRMPYFGLENLAHLPKALTTADGGAKHDAKKYFAGGKAEVGRKLMGTQGGLACISCHGWKGHRSLGIPGMDLETTTQRMQPAWFKENLLNPAGLRPRTLMPTFWPDGVGVNKQHFNGDAHLQIASIWQYLATGDKPAPGYPDFTKGQFELTPTDTAIVMRTFTVEGGTHSVVVGNPEGLHYIYDTLHGRLALSWRGRFIDAYSTWFDRFVSPAKPLGDHRVVFPSAPLLAVMKPGQQSITHWPKVMNAKSGYRYRGYRLDDARRPTFLYSLHDATVEDRIMPMPAPKEKDNDSLVLKRRLTVVVKQRRIMFSLPARKGVNIVMLSPRAFTAKTGPQTLPPGKTVIELEYR